MAFDPLFTHSDIIISNGNRTITMGGTVNAVKSSRAVLAAITPRYAEIKVIVGAISPFMGVGVTSADYSTQVSSWLNSWVYYQQTGEKYLGNTNQGVLDSAWAANNDVIGVAYDPEAGKLWFSKNGVWQGGGDPEAGLNPAFTGVPSGLYLFASLYRKDSPAHVLMGSFINDHFQYTRPARFSAWDEAATLSGNVTKSVGGAADQVVIRDAVTRELVRIVIPESNGDWTTEVSAGEYDITYFAEDFQPICNGPYLVSSQ